MAGGQQNRTSDESLKSVKGPGNYSLKRFGKVWLFLERKLSGNVCARRRARQYIQAYYVVEVLKGEEMDGGAVGENGNAIQTVTLPMIEKLCRDFKTHRAPLTLMENSFVIY
jgi:hypothetical protein